MVAGGKALSLIFEGSEIQVKARSCTDPEKAQVQLTEPSPDHTAVYTAGRAEGRAKRSSVYCVTHQ